MGYLRVAMWRRFVPWRYLLRRAALANGFVDPVAVLARLQAFAEPSEVQEPIELLRAGVVFHARGLLNSRAIQHNLDWCWPYWAERQFDPTDDAFLPRGFAISHVNLTHRNWTAVGLPDLATYPLVDPRGLVTPSYDGWSLDAWVLEEGGAALLPSRERQGEQHLELAEGLAVRTRVARGPTTLDSRVEVHLEAAGPVLAVDYRGMNPRGGWLVVALRPYNPEGVSLVHQVSLVGGAAWEVEGERRVELEREPERHLVSDYAGGDVLLGWETRDPALRVSCPVGMATAAALYRLEPGVPREVRLRAPLRVTEPHAWNPGPPVPWSSLLPRRARLEVPEPGWVALHEAAVRTLLLLSPGEVYPGPYTYRRFWFRDAAFVLEALLAAGYPERVRRTVDHYPELQRRDGYLRSQEGEWDSNGEALWIMERALAAAGEVAPPSWLDPVRRAARWIVDKRLPDDLDAPHAGLMPSGFSAEHLGPNDYYYWDDFWSEAGLRAAARLLASAGLEAEARGLRAEADSLAAAIARSVARAAARLGRPAIPAAPSRRLDAGAVGSLAGAYPLDLLAPGDPNLAGTVEHLMGSHRVGGGFFQDMIHSGVNPYLTLHLAQVLLRAGDPRHLELIRVVAALASPTGQWPEAVHPRTGGGCMGDGQHGWAAAEWVLMMRSLFVREQGEGLVLGSGVDPAWLEAGHHLAYGPTFTRHGPVRVTLEPAGARTRVSWEGTWRRGAPPISVRLPGRPPVAGEGGSALV